MQVLRAWQIDKKAEEDNKVGEPEDTEQDEIGFSAKSANWGPKPHTKEGP